MDVSCQLGQVRQQCGLSVAALAKRVGVQRQTIYSIEQGMYLPNTTLALRLARELNVRVEDLFALVSNPESSPVVKAKWLSSKPTAGGEAAASGVAVTLAECGGRWMAAPHEDASSYLPDADGVVANPGRSLQVMVAGDLETSRRSLLVAGCDPALSLLAAELQRVAGLRMAPLPACSETALEWLRQGLVHVAGCHLEDSVTGVFNIAALQRRFPDGDVLAITFAEWEQGFVVAPGNPHGLREAGDLASAGLQFVNREPGSGSRALFASLLKRAGLPMKRVRGHDWVADSHLAVARAVREGRAHCGIATSSAARAFRLGFIPLRRERFDLVLRKESLALPQVAALLDCVPRLTLRRKLEALAGYDTTHSGARVMA